MDHGEPGGKTARLDRQHYRSSEESQTERGRQRLENSNDKCSGRKMREDRTVAR